MSKVNCRRCDICGDEMGNRDFQYWICKPRIKWGAPPLGMIPMDICNDCFVKMAVLIKHPELIRRRWDGNELAGEGEGEAEA